MRRASEMRVVLPLAKNQVPAPVWVALRPVGLALGPVKVHYQKQSLQQRAQQILSVILNAHKILRAQRKLIHQNNRSDRDKLYRLTSQLTLSSRRRLDYTARYIVSGPQRDDSAWFQCESR